MSDHPARESLDALHRQLRAFLITTMSHESPETIAMALMYEVASLAATVASTDDDAHALIDAVVAVAHEQIDALGIGGPHP